MDYVLKLPSILGVSVTPNPASCRQNILISVEVTEITKLLQAEIIYAGDVFAGEMEV